MLSARCREPRPSQFSPRLQVRVISTSNIYLFIYLFIYQKRNNSMHMKINTKKDLSFKSHGFAVRRPVFIYESMNQ